MTTAMPLLAVDWGPVSSWVAAGVTLLAVLVAFILPWFWPWWRSPRLNVTFDKDEPTCRFTDLSGGGRAYWVRIKVENVGRGGALSCIGRFTAAWTGGEPRHDKDPMQLRWCGVPDSRGFDPIHLASGQHEFLDVFRITRGDSNLRFETFPGYAPGFPTALEAKGEHRVRITVIADNTEPAEVHLTVRYSGDFDALPGSLQVAATA